MSLTYLMYSKIRLLKWGDLRKATMFMALIFGHIRLREVVRLDTQYLVLCTPVKYLQVVAVA